SSTADLEKKKGKLKSHDDVCVDKEHNNRGKKSCCKFGLLETHCESPDMTYIGSIVASVNPYKTIPGLYDCAAMERYSKHHMGEIAPHIFAVANECYRCLWKRHDNQCILIR
ncbi:hypothetical protein CIB84_013231, partial [Bambusicola thoracicus]